jgi:NTP pyrophosphatase (non-canonical NTP hydrolase)
MKALQKEIEKFVDERDWAQFHSPKNLAMALSVEVAEIVEIFQWLTAFESRHLTEDKRGELIDEIGDVLIYLTGLASKFGIDPVEAAHIKLGRNRLKYPAARVKGKALKYGFAGDCMHWRPCAISLGKMR